MEGWGSRGREAIVSFGGWVIGRWDDSSCFRFFIYVCRVLIGCTQDSGTQHGPRFDMIPRYGLAGMYPKS